MAWPRFRPTTRRLMAMTAASALVLMVASNAGGHGGITDKRVVVPAACLWGALYGVGSMRRPLPFLAPLAATWIIMPGVDHPSPDIIHWSAGACVLGWIIGAPAGWALRCYRDA